MRQLLICKYHILNLSLILIFSLKGENERKFAETKMNHTSSRSHCVFKINLSTTLLNSKTTLSSSINLIDLAGSEGVAKSDIGGNRLK